MTDSSSIESLSDHKPQKRSAILSPEDDEVLMAEGRFSGIPYAIEDEPDKRSTLFRFGKRGSLFRFGKRGSLFRFGKRGSLFRFGKRGGALFRFGRSGPAADLSLDVPIEAEKRTLLRFGKRSDADVVRDILQQYPAYIEEPEEKRGVIDGFHWGHESDDE